VISEILILVYCGLFGIIFPTHVVSQITISHLHVSFPDAVLSFSFLTIHVASMISVSVAILRSG